MILNRLQFEAEN